MSIYFLQYECIPLSGSDNETEYGGAFISGWINADNLNNAQAIYAKGVEKYGWVPAVKEEAHKFDPTQSQDGSKDLEYYGQAQTDGEVFVVHTWPNEPENDEKLH